MRGATLSNTEAEWIPTAVEDNFESADEISELQVNISTTPDHAALDITRPEPIGDQLPLITDILGDPGYLPLSYVFVLG